MNFEPTISKSRSMESLLSVAASCSDEACFDSSTNLNMKSSNSNRRLSPARTRAKFIAEIDEVRVNPIVSKKGYLNFLEEKSIGWTKKFVVLVVCLFCLAIFICN